VGCAVIKGFEGVRVKNMRHDHGIVVFGNCEPVVEEDLHIVFCVPEVDFRFVDYLLEWWQHLRPVQVCADVVEGDDVICVLRRN